MRDLIREMGLRGDELYNPAMQDRMARHLLKRRGRSVSGLRSEWPGLAGVPADEILSSYDRPAIPAPAGVDVSAYDRRAVEAAAEFIARERAASRVELGRGEVEVRFKPEGARVTGVRSKASGNFSVPIGVDMTGKRPHMGVHPAGMPWLPKRQG